MKKKLLALAIVVITLTFFLPTVQATTMWTSRSAWEGAVGGVFAPVDVAGQLSIDQTLAPGNPLTLPYAETVSFSTSLTAVQVPGGGWATWSGGKTPRVLIGEGYTLTTVTGTFSDSVTAFGLEMEPDTFSVFPMTLQLSDGSLLTQEVQGDSGALFFGWTAGSISSMTLFISPNQAGGTTDFAFGEMVKSESTSTVPEPATMLLLGSGLIGMAAFARRKFKK